jgi:hypothetical protein
MKSTTDRNQRENGEPEGYVDGRMLIFVQNRNYLTEQCHWW